MGARSVVTHPVRCSSSAEGRERARGDSPPLNGPRDLPHKWDGVSSDMTGDAIGDVGSRTRGEESGT